MQKENSLTDNPIIAEEKVEDDQIDSRAKYPRVGGNSFSSDHYKTSDERQPGVRKRPMESNQNSNIFSKPNMFNTSRGK